MVEYKVLSTFNENKHNMKASIRLLSAIITLSAFFLSCAPTKTTSAKKDFLSSKSFSPSKKMKLLLENGHPTLPLTTAERKKLYNSYQLKGFQPFFNRTSASEQIKNNWKRTLTKAAHFGLPSSRLISFKEGHPLVQELLIYYQISTTLHDLDSGFIDFQYRKFKPKKCSSFPSNWLTSKQNTDSILLARGPADTNYHYFAQHLYHFCDTAKLDTLSYQLTTEKDNKLQAWGQLQKALIGLGYCDESTDSLGLRAALKLYQKKEGLNADGRIGSATVLSFAQSKKDQLYQAQISLDRLRQAAQKPTTFVEINLPSFSLQFVADDTLRAQRRIIIGKMDHPTPELVSRIYQIVALPYWRVPSSIARKEILPALKRNSGYLQKEHMRIYGAGKKEIDPQNVKWTKIKNNTFPYQIEQDPGPWNSLGLIKFEFANQFSVYVHDTPNRYLFGQNFRSFSHGCMRADDPIELGKLMLTYDKKGDKINKVNADSLQVLIDQKIHQRIPLLQHIPIFIMYHTVTSDRDGLYFHLDLYQREQDLIALFRSGNNG
jgi:hypothetical protein